MPPARHNIKSVTRVLHLIIFSVALAWSAPDAYGQVNGDYQTRATGNWNSNNTWQVRTGGAWVDCVAGDYPGAAPGAGTVNILNNHTVTVTANVPNSVGALSINGGNQDSYLQFNAGFSLVVTGETYLNSNSNNDEKSVRVDAGIFRTGSVNANSNGDSQDAYIRISTGTVTVDGNVALNGTAVRTYIRFTGNGNLFIGGSIAGGSITSTNNGGSAAPTSGTVIYNGLSNQNVGIYTYFNLRINNSAGVTLVDNVTVNNTLTMTQGNISTGSYLLTLSGNLAGSLAHTSGTVIGRISRTLSTTPGADYLFPVGTADNYRPATLNFSSLGASVSITAEYVESPPLGFTGYTDGAVTLNSIFTEGYWRFSSTGTPAANYSLSLNADGFASFLINANTRITGRDNTNSTWRALGTHGTVSGAILTRTGISNLNTTSFDYGLASECSTAAMSYSFERDITVDYTKVAGGSDLYNFPILVSYSGATFLRSSPLGPIMNTNGYDIIFTDSNRNKLDHQIEYYNGTNGDLIAWVRIPVLSCSSNTVIKLLYGNSQITTDPSVSTVWDSHYKGVWHLNDNNLEDATVYDFSGTPYNTPSYSAGTINNSLQLNGSDEYVQVNNNPNINFAGNITVSAWVNMDTRTRDQKIAGNQNNSSGGYKFGIFNNNKVEFEIRNSANTPSLNRDVAGGTVLNTGQWYYLAGISSDVLDSIKTFVNGVSERPFKKTGILGIASDNLVIGKEPFLSDYYFDGRFDELRISDKVRSDGWLRTEYNNQSSPSAFYSTGSEVSLTTLPSAGICDVPVTLPAGYPAGGTYSGNPYISGNVFTPPVPGTYPIVYTYNGVCGPASIAKNITITPVPPAPAAPDREYCFNQITYLDAVGENIRWYSGGSLVSTANPFSTGQTAAGTYNYTVTQTVNGCESNPEPVVLTIYGGATIITQPLPETICEGESAVFTVVASGYNLVYRWQEDGVNITDGGIYSGATTAELTLASPALALSGNDYRCVITTTCGTSPVTSNTVQLTVNPSPVATFSYAGSPYCPNAADPFPTFSGGGVAGIFSSTAGLVFVNAATGQVDISASIPGTYTVTNTIPPAGGCQEVIATSPVIIISTITWTGAVSSDWNNSGNWTCGFIPSSAVSVYIPDEANEPVLSGASAGTVNNLEISGNSSLTVSGSTLTICGSVTTASPIDAAGGTIIFAGDEAQSIPSGTFTGNTVNNLTVNNEEGVLLLDTLKISGVVNIQDGSLASDGFLTLISDAVQTALIDGSGTGEITGLVNMQRYLPSKYGYKYFSSPFQAATVGEFSDDMDLASPFPLFYRNEENSRGAGWISYTDPDSILYPLEGYAVNFGASATPWTVDVTGEVNNGPLSVTLYNHDSLYTDGFNLVGNPYPSPIRWTAPGWTKTNIDNAVYYFRASDTDEYGGEYSSYINGISSDGIASDTIPSMQGFFVRVSDGAFPVTGTLGVSNSVRINDLTHPFLKSAPSSTRFLVRATASFTGDKASEDPMVIYFNDEAGAGFDSEYDALKLMNTDLMMTNFYSVLSNGKKLSINALPAQTDTATVVPLGLKTYINGELNFRIRDIENLPEGGKIYFRDRLTGANVNLLPDQNYRITLNAGDYNDRFFLAFLKGTTGIDVPAAQNKIFTAYSVNNVLKATINLVEDRRGTITVFDLAGRPLYITEVNEAGYYEFETGIMHGIYIVSYITGGKSNTTKLFMGY